MDPNASEGQENPFHAHAHSVIQVYDRYKLKHSSFPRCFALTWSSFSE